MGAKGGPIELPGTIGPGRSPGVMRERFRCGPRTTPPAAERRPPITVVLVDDEQLIRVALAQALSSSGLELVGEAATGADAIELVVDVRPDVVLMDLHLPGISGVQAIEQLGLLAPTSRVLVLTRSEHNRVVEAIIAGARGYILKSAPVEAIISAVKATAAGESVLSSKIAGKLLQLHARLVSKDKVEEVRAAKDLGDFFRANYAKAKAIAKGGTGDN